MHEPAAPAGGPPLRLGIGPSGSSVAGLIFEIFVGVEVIEIVVVIGVVDELIVGVPHTTTSFQSPSPAKWDRHERTATFVALEQPLDFNRRCALTSLAVRHHK